MGDYLLLLGTSDPLVPDLPSPTTCDLAQADQTDLLGELTVGGARAQRAEQSTPEVLGGPRKVSLFGSERVWTSSEMVRHFGWSKWR